MYAFLQILTPHNQSSRNDLNDLVSLYYTVYHFYGVEKTDFS